MDKKSVSSKSETNQEEAAEVDNELHSAYLSDGLSEVRKAQSYINQCRIIDREACEEVSHES